MKALVVLMQAKNRLMISEGMVKDHGNESCVNMKNKWESYFRANCQAGDTRDYKNQGGAMA